MATNLTRLNVALTLTTGAFAAGIVSAQKQIQGFGARLASSLNPLASLSGMLSAGALLYGFKATADRMRDLANASASLGITSEKLAGLRWAADQSGASAEQLDKALGKLQVRVAQAGAGNDAAIQAFRSLGLSIAKLSGMSADQKFGAVADAIAKMPDPAQRAAAAVALFGEEGAKLLPILNQGAAGIKQMTDNAKQLGVVVGDETTQALARASESMDRIMARASGIGTKIAAWYAPAIEAIDMMVNSEQDDERVQTRINKLKAEWIALDLEAKKALVRGDGNERTEAFFRQQALNQLTIEGMARVKAERAERARLAAEQEAAWARLKAGWDKLAPAADAYGAAVVRAMASGDPAPLTSGLDIAADRLRKTATGTTELDQKLRNLAATMAAIGSKPITVPAVSAQAPDAPAATMPSPDVSGMRSFSAALKLVIGDGKAYADTMSAIAASHAKVAASAPSLSMKAPDTSGMQSFSAALKMVLGDGKAYADSLAIIKTSQDAVGADRSAAAGVQSFADTLKQALQNGQMFVEMSANIKASQAAMASDSAAAAAEAWAQYFANLLAFEQEFAGRVMSVRMQGIDADILARSAAWEAYYANQFQFEQTMAQGLVTSRLAASDAEMQAKSDQWAMFYNLDMLAERARQDGLNAEESRGFQARLKAGESYHAVEVDMAKAAAEKKRQIQANAYQGFRNMLSNLAVLQESHDKRAQAIGKAAAKASIIVNTADAAMKSYQSLAGIPYVGPYLGAAAAAAAVAAGAVQLSNVDKGTMGAGGATSIDTSNVGGAGGASAPENRQTVLVQGDYLTPETMQRIFADAKERGIIIDGVRRA
jgi:hypothetical protein